MTSNVLLERPDSQPDLEDDQQDVFDQYHTGETGRVCVDAGAGTGKTTTLIETVAEAVLQELDTGNPNPMEDILVTTFTVDASAELKSDLKQRLRQHEAEADADLDPSIWHQIETESYVQTIDSFVHDLLAEIAAEIGLPTAFEIRTGLEEEDLYDEVMATLREDEELAEAITRLEAAYPERDYLPYPPASVRDLLITVHEKRREFCWSIEELQRRLEEGVTEHMYAGNTPPFDDDDVRAIGADLTGERGTVTDELVEHVNHVYDHNLELVREFGQLAERFNESYEQLVREEGALSHTDVTYYVWHALENGGVDNWATSLQDRFEHIFIDEFQDTNYAQCRILSHFVRNNEPTNGILLIGDVKQSIYQWRSAEPRIFAEIIAHARQNAPGTDDYLEIDGLEYQPLTSNFRSHQHLVDAANHLFDDIFADPGRGDIGFEVPYTPLNAQRTETESEEPHLHVLNIDDPDGGPIQQREAERVAQTVNGIIDGDQIQVVDTDNSDPVTDPDLTAPKPGDIALLFRRRRHMDEYARHLEEYGVATALDVTSGLFREPEIQLLINVLDWFAHPHSKNSLVRILRSPITAISDETLRYLASQNFYLSAALDEWPAEELATQDRERIEALIKLRDDLRWDREGAKADLIQRTIRHTAFDAIVLTDTAGKQRYGNLWQLIEVVNQWEEEELLNYREFVTRLKRLQSRAVAGDEEYPIAQIADDDSDEVVRLTTVHQSKGLEYPIVFMPDLDVSAVHFPYQERMYLARQHGIALHPQTGDQQPVDYSPGGGGKWLKDEGSGTIWVSGKKQNDGSLQYDNQLHHHLRDDIAEHWRVLYVAFTRAAEHLFVGLHDGGGNGHESWMGALQEHFEPPDGWEAGTDWLNVEWIDEGGRVTREIPVGIDEIRSGTRTPPDPIGIETVETEVQYADENFVDLHLDFIPRSVTPTSLHDLLECPLRFQYSMLQRVSELRADVPPESNPPEPLQPSAWGGIVHKALEQLHEGDDELDRFLETCAENVEQRLQDDVLPAYRTTQTWESVVSEATEILPEYELEGVLTQSGTELYLSGQIDLLYQTPDGWHIVDFKTGAIPDEGEYLYDDYRYQLTAYAWLLRDAFNITVESARLVFVSPSVEEVEIEVNLEAFVRSLEEVPGTLTLESEDGLIAKPDPKPDETTDLSPYSRCGSCAYRELCPEWRDQA